MIDRGYQFVIMGADVSTLKKYLRFSLPIVATAAMMPDPCLAEDELVNDLQAWQMVTLQTKMGPGKRILGYLEAQPRIGNLDGNGTRTNDFSLLLIRPALGYQLNKHVSVWQGYAWAPQFLPYNRNENRIFQQLLITNNIKKLTLVNRTRLEERFIERTDHTSVRLRHLLRAAYPIGRSKKWSIIGQNEFFVNLNSVIGGPQAGVDQNRAFVGFNRKINEHVNAETGYMNQYVNAKDPIANRMNHVIVLTLNFQL